MEISREVLQDLMGKVNIRLSAKSARFGQRVQEKTELYLVALLLQIAEEVEDPRKAHYTPQVVEYSTFTSRLQQAREYLAQMSETAPSA